MNRAIVILGAAVWANEQPSPTLKRRVNKAVELWQTGKYDLVMPSGGLGKFPPTEAEMMQRLLLSLGVPESSVILESYSTSTLTNAVFSAHLLAAKEIYSACVVTDGYHRLRSYLSFRRVGIDCMTVSASATKPCQQWSIALRGWLRECLALPVYLMRLYLYPLPRLPTGLLRP